MNGDDRSSQDMAPVRVTLKVFGGLRPLRDSPFEEHALPPDSTIEDLWASLEPRAPQFVGKLREGIESGYLHVLVNGRNAVFLDGPVTKLKDGDTIAVLPPIGGG